MDTNCNDLQPIKTYLEDNKEYEILLVETTKANCSLCEDYCLNQSTKNDLTAVISCEGACLRGEVSRRVANKICFDEFPEETARVCLGSAFTKNTGQRDMVRSAKRVVVLEGCAIKCATRMMKSVIPALKPEVILVDQYYNFDKKLFAINDTEEENIRKFCSEATSNIKNKIKYSSNLQDKCC